MAQLDEDTKVLHEMGYAQELSRRMGGFQSFAISFSIICIISGGLGSFPIALGTGGPWAATIGWVIGGVFALIVAASLGQIASAYPTAGSLYHWSTILGGKFWGWLTAYINLLGLLFVIPAVNVILYLFTKDLFFGPVLGYDTSGWDNTVMFLWVAAFSVLQALLNHFGIRLTTFLTDIAGYLIFIVTIFLIALFLMAAPSLDFSKIFEFANTTGPTGSDVAPLNGGFAAEYGLVMAVLMGMLYPLFTITGFDASAHTAEETVNASETVHKGMLTSVFWSLVFGFVLATSMVACLPLAVASLPEAAKAAAGANPTPLQMAALGWGAFNEIYKAVILKSALGPALTFGILIANFLCALAALTSTSRMIYAFARDGGMPGALAGVSKTFRTPVLAIWFTAFMSMVFLVISTQLGAYAALSTGCAMYLYISYGMPVIAGLFAEGRSWTKFGSFRLGGFLSRLFAVLVLIGTVLVTIAGHAFVPGLWMYSLGYLVILGVAWVAFEGRRFQGPPVTDEAIAKRQATIRAREAELGA